MVSPPKSECAFHQPICALDRLQTKEKYRAGRSSRAGRSADVGAARLDDVFGVGSRRPPETAPPPKRTKEVRY